MKITTEVNLRPNFFPGVVSDMCPREKPILAMTIQEG